MAVKNILTEIYSETIYGPVRSECHSVRVSSTKNYIISSHQTISTFKCLFRGDKNGSLLQTEPNRQKK